MSAVEGYSDLESLWRRQDGVQEFRVHRECSCGRRSVLASGRGTEPICLDVHVCVYVHLWSDVQRAISNTSSLFYVCMRASLESA
jgi:hypothetical protein